MQDSSNFRFPHMLHPSTIFQLTKGQTLSPGLRHPHDLGHKVSYADDPLVVSHVVVPLPDRRFGLAGPNRQVAPALVWNGRALGRALLPGLNFPKEGY